MLTRKIFLPHKARHQIYLGVQDIKEFKGKDLLQNPNTQAFEIPGAITNAEVVLIATPPTAIVEILKIAGNLSGKIVIDATNTTRPNPDMAYPTAYHYLVAQSQAEVVKCFNSTGFENMKNPTYKGEGIDMFMAGDSPKAKEVAKQLALDCGFSTCWDFGKGDKVELLEKFALSWINLAIMQGHGRNIAFKVVKR
ncbi:MAG: hypothetical protein OHK0045_20830 [Raineya sp.]